MVLSLVSQEDKTRYMRYLLRSYVEDNRKVISTTNFGALFRSCAFHGLSRLVLVILRVACNPAFSNLSLTMSAGEVVPSARV